MGENVCLTTASEDLHFAAYGDDYRNFTSQTYAEGALNIQNKFHSDLRVNTVENIIGFTWLIIEF